MCMKTTPFALALCLALFMATPSQARDADDIIRDAIDHWRGVSSVAKMTMIVHRPDFERRMSMKSWTLGEKKSLVRVTAPSRDKGNSTLIDDKRMWSYSPKINRVIKIPPSMMGQSWMGSDFSNKDISKTDEIIDSYQHRIITQKTHNGFTEYQIESIPNEESAIVWGKEVLVIRQDNVMLSHHFYDQDGVLVKFLKTYEIAAMGGRTVALRQRMQKADVDDEWTEMRVDDIAFNVDLNKRLFTLSSLQNPRDP
jgi:outer membrane lipoprotein-sorting protein